jgi:hypothetical protein
MSLFMLLLSGWLCHSSKLTLCSLQNPLLACPLCSLMNFRRRHPDRPRSLQLRRQIPLRLPILRLVLLHYPLMYLLANPLGTHNRLIVMAPGPNQQRQRVKFTPQKHGINSSSHPQGKNDLRLQKRSSPRSWGWEPGAWYRGLQSVRL